MVFWMRMEAYKGAERPGQTDFYHQSNTTGQNDHKEYSRRTGVSVISRAENYLTLFQTYKPQYSIP
jgi:hypothetical protein